MKDETDEWQSPGTQEVVDTASLVALNRSEIDIQIATAKKYPRSIDKFRKELKSMACADEETAESMYYVLRRKSSDGGVKSIQGPSIRFAEIVGSCWGNIRYGGRVVEVGDRYVSAQGVAFDLERNVASSIEVRRRITGTTGKRFGDDMITTTGNAALSIAIRNAILGKVVPALYWRDIYEAARTASLGKDTPITERRRKAIEWFGKKGITQEQVLLILDKRAVEQIDLEDIVTLSGIKTALLDGEQTVDQLLAMIRPEQSVTPSDLSTEALAGAKVEAINDARPEEPARKREEVEAAARPSDPAQAPADANFLRPPSEQRHKRGSKTTQGDVVDEARKIFDH